MSQYQSVVIKFLNNTSGRVHLAQTGRIIILLVFFLSMFGSAPVRVQAASVITFAADELLGPSFEFRFSTFVFGVKAYTLMKIFRR